MSYDAVATRYDAYGRDIEKANFNVALINRTVYITIETPKSTKHFTMTLEEWAAFSTAIKWDAA